MKFDAARSMSCCSRGPAANQLILINSYLLVCTVLALAYCANVPSCCLASPCFSPGEGLL